jgi:hypothetical protein
LGRKTQRGEKENEEKGQEIACFIVIRSFHFSMKELKQSIKFNKRIYSRSAISAAIRAYRRVANLSLDENKRYYIVTIMKKDPDVGDSIKDEFCNYVISLRR